MLIVCRSNGPRPRRVGKDAIISFFYKRYREPWTGAPTRAVILASFVCLASGSTRDATAAPLDKVSIALTPTIVFAPVYVAVDKGYFKDEGIDIEVQSTPMATDSIAMAANGQSDIGATATGVSLFNAGYRGLDFKIVASMGVHPAPLTMIPLMIRKDLWDSGAIRSAKDLKGRAISTNAPGGSIDYKLTLILDKYGMTLQDVRMVGIGLPETLIALQNHAIDAAILGEPFATQAKLRGLAVVDVADSGEAVGDLGTVIVYGGSFMKKRHEVAVRALRAMARAAKDLQPGNWKTPENVAIFAKRFKMSPEVIGAMAFPYFEPNLQVVKYIPSLEHQARIHARNKRMSSNAIGAVAGMIDESFVTQASASR